MPGPFSRARPFPYDAEIDPGDGSGSVGLMLVPGQDGLLVARSEESLANVAPTEYGYASQDPRTETVFTFGRLTGGMGEAVQAPGAAPRYRYALDVDCSIAGMPRLGPEFTVQTLPAPLAGATDVRQFIVGPGPTSTDLLYALRGRGVYVLSGGAWSLSRDFTGINYPVQAAVFQGTAGSRYLLVTTVTGQLWAFDGTTWNASPFAAGEVANTVAVVGNEVYIGGNNELRVATGNVLTPGVFGGIIRVGHAGTRITWLQAVGAEIVIFKSDGVYTVNADGSDNDLFPELRPQASAVNGVNAVAWRDALWFGYGDGYYRMTSDGDLTPIGPERIVENTSTVRGVPVGGTPHSDWFLYLLVYNAEVNTTFLFKYGTWANTDATSDYEFLDAWHGAIAHWVGKVGTRADVVYVGGVPTLYVGFADGSIEATVLPTGTPDPATDDSCRFVTQGDLYWPLHHADFPATVKSFHAVAGVGPALSASLTATQYYRPTPASAYQSIGTPFTTTGQRVTFPLPQAGVVLDTFTRLATTTDTLTPVLEHVALFEAIRPHSPTLRLGWSFTARAADRVPRRDAVPSPVPASRIRAALRAAQQAPGRAIVRLPDETVGNLEAVTYQEVLAPDERRVGLDHAIALRLTAVV